MVFPKSFLHGMQHAVLCQPLDRGHLGALGLQRQRGAALHRFAVDMHDAGAALAGVAAHMRAGQAQMIAKELNEQGPGFHFPRNGLAVHRHGNGD
jgi:hypothetical protein